MRTFPALIVIAMIVSVPAIARRQAQQDKSSIGPLIKAAEQGDVKAQVQLGNEYLTGENIPQNSAEAIKWYGKAAELGSRTAQIQLSNIYTKGIGGISKDNVQAYMWLELAADPSPSRATGPSLDRYRESLAKEMTFAQIAEAKRLAGEWRFKHPQSPSLSMAAPTPPVPLFQPLPPYTDKAREAGVEGSISLQCIVRKDGTVDSFKVIRGLGFGLDESAIDTIATKWRFKPGALNGVPVDTQANIEVTFRLPKENK
jgi:TonB family protein